MDFRVTASLLVRATSQKKGGRLGEEKRILAQHFPEFSIKSDTEFFAVGSGAISTFAGRRYELRVVLPAGYPHKCPLVYPDGWKPQRNPHLIGDRLCIMRDSQWQSFMSVAFVVAKSALWLNKYEIYLDKRVWPGAEQHQHGVIYQMRKLYHGL